MTRIERREPAPGGRVCAFTGHRPSKLPFLKDENDPKHARLSRKLEERLEELAREGYTHFVSGAALGVDTLAAEKVLLLREKHPEVTLELAIPCPEQSGRWSAADKERYNRLVERADVVTTVCPMYAPFVMQERNCYMVEKCDLLLAVYDGSAGGTRNALSIALDMKKQVEIIDPNRL